MVGQRLVQLLDGHPQFRVTGLAASGASSGKRYREAAAWRIPGRAHGGLGEMPVRASDPGALADAPAGIAFSALPTAAARELEPAFAGAGWAVVSNASAYRKDPRVPLVVPEVNPDHLALTSRQETPGFLVTNPNCVAIPLALSLKPLHDAALVEEVLVSTYQAVSGAGFGGETAWDMIGTVHPHAGDEEEKVQEEPQKILGRVSEDGLENADIRISARCVRVPVRDGHLLAVSVRTRNPVSPEEARDLFASWRPQTGGRLPSAPEHPVQLRGDRDRPSPALDVDTAGGMGVTVGRVERCPVLGLKYYVLGHNTVRGAAGAALLNAELLCTEPWAGLRKVSRRGRTQALPSTT
jgi:aspartate-semialdehyde dehydrogenase